MYTKQIVGFILFSIVMIIMSGCTSQAWYEGVKESANNNCRNQPPSEVNRCLDKLNNKTYEEYEKERSGQK